MMEEDFLVIQKGWSTWPQQKRTSVCVRTNVTWGITWLKEHLGQVYMNPALLHVTREANLPPSRNSLYCY